MVDQLLDGNGLIGIDRTGQRVHGLWRMLPRDAKVAVNSFGKDYYSRAKSRIEEAPDRSST